MAVVRKSNAGLKPKIENKVDSENLEEKNPESEVKTQDMPIGRKSEQLNETSQFTFKRYQKIEFNDNEVKIIKLH